jgi:hypothetical protein
MLSIIMGSLPRYQKSVKRLISAERDGSLPCPFFEVLFCATTAFYLSLIFNMAMLAVLERAPTIAIGQRSHRR